MWPHPECTKQPRTQQPQSPLNYKINNTNNNMSNGHYENVNNNMKRNDNQYNNNRNMENRINNNNMSIPMAMDTNYMYYDLNSGNNASYHQQNYNQRQIIENSDRLNQDIFLRMKSSSTPTPINNQHDHYMIDRNANNISNLDMERGMQNTRNIGRMKYNEPVQTQFQQSGGYFMNNFETLNNMNRGVPMFDNIDTTTNKFLERNPVNTRRDQMEKERNADKNKFMEVQGGVMNNFVDMNPQYTRKGRQNVNSSSYVPMARTLAIPKENI